MRYIVFLVSLLLSACAVTGYKDFTGTPSAKLRAIYKGELATYSFTKMAKCPPLHLNQQEVLMGKPGFAFNTYENMRANMIDSPPIMVPFPVTERVIPADTPFFLSVGSEQRISSMTSRVCSIKFSFTPNANGQYEAIYNQHGNTCNVEIYALGYELNGQVTRKPVDVTMCPDWK